MLRKSLFAIILGIPLAFGWTQDVPISSFLPESQQRSGEQAATREEELYRDGQTYLNESNWQAAAEKFAQVVALKGRRADAGLYWRAYSLNKLGRRQEALTTIAQLRSQFPQSSWLKDAGALELEIRGAAGQKVSPSSAEDDEIKLLALNSLMNSEPERALPVLQNFINSAGTSPKLKERALFVLAQSDSPKAHQLLLAIAQGQSNPDLQLKAIEYIGISDIKDSGAVLGKIYASTNDQRIKRKILHAYLTSDNKQALLAAAQKEPDPELRREAIHQLGAMNANAELRAMLQSVNSYEDKRAIVDALAISGDTATLAQIAQQDPDPKVRRAAIRGLGIAGGPQAADMLVKIYTTANDREMRKAAVEGLFIHDAARQLVELARKESDPEMRKYLVGKLSVMDNKEARDYMLELLNK